MTYLLDTNVVSEATRLRPDRGVASWLEGAGASELHLSVITLGEVRAGIERLRPRDPHRAGLYADWLEDLRLTYAGRILVVDDAIAQAWGRVRALASVAAIDGLLAATALVHGLVVVTRDTAPFARAGVPFVDPWQSST